MPRHDEGAPIAAIPARQTAASRERARERDKALLGGFLAWLREDRMLTLSGFAGGIVGTGDDAAVIGAFLEREREGESR